MRPAGDQEVQSSQWFLGRDDPSESAKHANGVGRIAWLHNWRLTPEYLPIYNMAPNWSDYFKYSRGIEVNIKGMPMEMNILY